MGGRAGTGGGGGGVFQNNCRLKFLFRLQVAGLKEQQHESIQLFILGVIIAGHKIGKELTL
jgi:hypothetical protein